MGLYAPNDVISEHHRLHVWKIIVSILIIKTNDETHVDKNQEDVLRTNKK